MRLIGGNDYALKVAPGAVAATIAALSREPAVTFAEPNYVMQAFTVNLPPNDPDYLDSPDTVWAPQQINAEAGWNVTTGDPNLIVAVLDSGISFAHPEFSGRITVGDQAGYDFVNGDSNPSDDRSHGTHVSGIIGADINHNYNGHGMVGIAPTVKIMPVKVLGADGLGNSLWTADGIYWAVDHGAKIINLSLGSTASASVMLNALRYAVQHGVLPVCAAGNNASSTPFYPAAYVECVAVTGTMQRDVWYSLSNYGSYVDISAPAEAIWSTYWTASNPADFWWKEGTSQAAPHVAGLAALLFSVNPNLGLADVRAIMGQSAVDLGASRVG